MAEPDIKPKNITISIVNGRCSVDEKEMRVRKKVEGITWIGKNTAATVTFTGATPFAASTFSVPLNGSSGPHVPLDSAQEGTRYSYTVTCGAAAGEAQPPVIIVDP
jgi:hypothetical protein